MILCSGHAPAYISQLAPPAVPSRNDGCGAVPRPADA